MHMEKLMKEAYAFDLKFLCGGFAYFSTYTSFVSFSEKLREVRESSLVNASRFEESLALLGQSVIKIKSEEDFKVWLYKKGWALVSFELAREIMPQWLKKKTCLTSPLGLFTDIALVSPSSLKRSYSQSKKNYVINRDGGKCLLCDATENLTMQHILPYSKGGETSSRNMVTLCEKCNQSLTDMHMTELYEIAGLHHRFDPSIIRQKKINYEIFLKAVQFSSNLMQSRCEVW